MLLMMISGAVFWSVWSEGEEAEEEGGGTGLLQLGVVVVGCGVGGVVLGEGRGVIVRGPGS